MYMTSAGLVMETLWCLALSTTLLLCGTSTKVCLDSYVCVQLIFRLIWPICLLSISKYFRFAIPPYNVKCARVFHGLRFYSVSFNFLCVKDRNYASWMTTRVTCRGWRGILWGNMLPLSAVTGRKEILTHYFRPLRPVCVSFFFVSD